MFGIGASRRGGMRMILAAAVCGALCGLGGAAALRAQDASASAAGTTTVTIDNFAFTPDTLTIKPGTKVTFINHDDIPHTVVAVDKSFRSKALDTDDKYEFTFATVGTFDYFCGLHPRMTAKIVVAP